MVRPSRCLRSSCSETRRAHHRFRHRGHSHRCRLRVVAILSSCAGAMEWLKANRPNVACPGAWDMQNVAQRLHELGVLFVVFSGSDTSDATLDPVFLRWRMVSQAGATLEGRGDAFGPAGAVLCHSRGPAPPRLSATSSAAASAFLASRSRSASSLAVKLKPAR